MNAKRIIWKCAAERELMHHIGMPLWIILDVISRFCTFFVSLSFSVKKTNINMFTSICSVKNRDVGICIDYSTRVSSKNVWTYDITNDVILGTALKTQCFSQSLTAGVQQRVLFRLVQSSRMACAISYVNSRLSTHSD